MEEVAEEAVEGEEEEAPTITPALPIRTMIAIKTITLATIDDYLLCILFIMNICCSLIVSLRFIEIL